MSQSALMQRFQGAVVCAGAAASLFLAAWAVEARKRQQQETDASPEEEEEPVTPLDIRLGLTQPLTTTTPNGDAKTKVVRWAFLGAGRVAHDFANAMKAMPAGTTTQAELYCVAVRSEKDLERCRGFADAHGFKVAYGSYAEALADPKVDVVYLSAMHSSRVEHVHAILDAGKNALVEKPIACRAEDAQAFFAKARAKNLFLMEGMWTRFFPAVEKARELMDAGIIGPVTAVSSDFGFDAADSGAYPKNPNDVKDGDPIYHASIGGGALLWTGPYPIAAGLLPFHGTPPFAIAAAGTADAIHTGVELSAAIALSFASPGGADGRDTASSEGTRGSCPARGATACLFAGIDSETKETTTYVGQLGRLLIDTPGHCPTRLVMELKAKGRGAVERRVFDFSLPALPSTAAPATKDGSEYFHYPNSMGFLYEAMAVTRAVAAGRTGCPQYTAEECLTTMTIIETARNAILASSKTSS